jgi:hypothetical protein
LSESAPPVSSARRRGRRGRPSRAAHLSRIGRKSADVSP